MTGTPRRVGTALAVAAILLIQTGCAASTGSDGETPSPRAASTSRPTTPTLPQPAAFELEEYEPARTVKEATVDFLEEALTYDEGEDGTEAARQRVPESGAADAAIEALTPLLEHSEGAAVDIIYPQLGGLTESKASVMTLIELKYISGRNVSSESRVLDVRLEDAGESWSVESIETIGGDLAEPSPDRTATEETAIADGGTAKAIGNSDSITLTDTSREDLADGEIDPRVLEVVHEFSEDHQVGIAVLRTGHPHEVFGSTSVSNHSRGRAVDIWEIDGKPVSYYAQQGEEENPARDLMEFALESGSDEVGGPWAFWTDAGATFTNTVHQDHIHIGFKQ